VSVVVNSVPSNTNVSLEVINPVISTVAPRSGAPGGTVVINGSGFGAGGGQVNFNNVAASVVSWSDTSISATVPSNAVSGPVTVANLGLTSNGVQFTLEGQPAITALSPSSGQNGTQVTITGSGFGATQSSSTVLFNGMPPPSTVGVTRRSLRTLHRAHRLGQSRSQWRASLLKLRLIR
jgi:hypothetical protein